MVFDKNIICQIKSEFLPAAELIRGEITKIRVSIQELPAENGFAGQSDSFENFADFYYKDSEEGIALSASGRLLSLLNFTFEEISAILQGISPLAQAAKVKNFPLLLSVIGFDDGGDDPLWQNLPATEWFFPEKITYLRDGRLFSAHLSMPDDFQQISTPGDDDSLEMIMTSMLDKPEESSDEQLWSDNISYIRSAIETGDVTKVVLARRITGLLPQGFYPHEIFREMMKENPRDTAYYIRNNNAVFMGVTPEKLLQVHNDVVKTEAIAGSIKRNGVYNEQQMEDVLTSSEKDLDEHLQVREFLVENLSGFTTGLTFEPKPSVKKLKNLFHLMTEITGKLKNPGLDTTLRLASGLFPTPAVCGTPKKKAYEIIKELEESPRGYYSGVIGYMCFNGDCELAVSIRSVLLRNSVYAAYAGCGIVKNSDAKLEFEESRVKLKTATAPFEYANQP